MSAERRCPMALENRNLEAGTRLVARYKGQTYSAEVVETEEGLRYRLEDGHEFKSPSAAGGPGRGGGRPVPAATPAGGRWRRRRTPSPPRAPRATSRTAPPPRARSRGGE